jgi:hypothetical protein
MTPSLQAMTRHQSRGEAVICRIITITHNVNNNGSCPHSAPFYPCTGYARNFQRPFFIIGITPTLRRVLVCLQSALSEILFTFDVSPAAGWLNQLSVLSIPDTFASSVSNRSGISISIAPAAAYVIRNIR